MSRKMYYRVLGLNRCQEIQWQQLSFPEAIRTLEQVCKGDLSSKQIESVTTYFSQIAEGLSPSESLSVLISCERIHIPLNANALRFLVERACSSCPIFGSAQEDRLVLAMKAAHSLGHKTLYPVAVPLPPIMLTTDFMRNTIPVWEHLFDLYRASNVVLSEDHVKFIQSVLENVPVTFQTIHFLLKLVSTQHEAVELLLPSIAQALHCHMEYLSADASSDTLLHFLYCEKRYKLPLPPVILSALVQRLESSSLNSTSLLYFTTILSDEVTESRSLHWLGGRVQSLRRSAFLSMESYILYVQESARSEHTISFIVCAMKHVSETPEPQKLFDLLQLIIFEKTGIFNYEETCVLIEGICEVSRDDRLLVVFPVVNRLRRTFVDDCFISLSKAITMDALRTIATFIRKFIVHFQWVPGTQNDRKCLDELCVRMNEQCIPFPLDFREEISLLSKNIANLKLCD